MVLYEDVLIRRPGSENGKQDHLFHSQKGKLMRPVLRLYHVMVSRFGKWSRCSVERTDDMHTPWSFALVEIRVRDRLHGDESFGLTDI